MKILYAIQGTGNGHLSRSMDVVPALMKRAHVDVLVSGVQADLDMPFPIRYRCKGVSFIFGKRGGVDLFETFRRNKTGRVLREIRECPVQKYDLVINDFEPISAWACRLKGVKCISLSHQAALRSRYVPRPGHSDWIGSFILRNYAPCDGYYGFHFKRYDFNIFTPIIRNAVRGQEITEKGHYTVYLPAYGDKKIIKILSKIKEVNWHVFSKHTKEFYQKENVHVEPVNSERFTTSMAASTGVLCGAGFERPAEALYLMKKLMVIPMKGQYEQHFNAEGLRDVGVPVIKKLSKKKVEQLSEWVKNGKKISIHFPNETQKIIDQVLQEHIAAPEYRPEKLELPFLKFRTQ